MNTIQLGSRTTLTPDNIIYLEADINYTLVHHAEGNCQLVSTSMKHVMNCLIKHGDFLRIGRNQVINVSHVKKHLAKAYYLVMIPFFNAF